MVPLPDPRDDPRLKGCHFPSDDSSVVTEYDCFIMLEDLECKVIAPDNSRWLELPRATSLQGLLPEYLYGHRDLETVQRLWLSIQVLRRGAFKPKQLQHTDLILAIQEAYIGREDEDNSENEDENYLDRKVEDVGDIGEETGNEAQEEEMRDEEGTVEEGKTSAIGALYYRLVDLADIVNYLDQQADMEQLEREGTVQSVEGMLRRYLREVVKAYGRYTGLRNH